MTEESAAERATRERQRLLFDSVAEQYQRTRSGFPAELVDGMVVTAGVRPGDPVLEVGCGTGQLTRQLAPCGVSLTAVDLGPSMVALARTQVDPSVRFEICSFEEFDGADGTFALVTSATAFHWIDPELAWAKVARLLRPSGWLALLETRETYDEPVGSALLQLWVDRSPDHGAWLDHPKPPFAATIADSGRFAAPLVRSHSERRALPSDHVVGLELTRATTLSYGDATRRSFIDDLQALLASSPEVHLDQRTTLTMAQVLPQS